MTHPSGPETNGEARPDLDALTGEQLLGLRFCDLPVAIEGTWLEECIAKLYAELDARGISYHPVCYLADEWLTPENEPVVGIPFYLAHPALIRLEKDMMLEAEGETRDWCMQLLRHEAGHAIGYAYGLNRKPGWRKVFGSPNAEYGDTYRFRPYSKNYVRHLDGFYAQFHPDEDFVETFAVWLTPGSDWETRYRGWKALEKLRYIDKLMASLRGKPPLKAGGRKCWHIRNLKSTLRSHYKVKQKIRQEDFPHFHDRNLLKIFTVRTPDDGADVVAAAELIRRHRRAILNEVAGWTGERKYVIADLLKNLQHRSRELKLVSRDAESVAALRLTAYVTTLVMNYVYTGWFRGE